MILDVTIFWVACIDRASMAVAFLVSLTPDSLAFGLLLWVEIGCLLSLWKLLIVPSNQMTFISRGTA